MIELSRTDVVVLFDYYRYQRSAADLASRVRRSGATVLLITDDLACPGGTGRRSGPRGVQHGRHHRLEPGGGVPADRAAHPLGDGRYRRVGSRSDGALGGTASFRIASGAAHNWMTWRRIALMFPRRASELVLITASLSITQASTTPNIPAAHGCSRGYAGTVAIASSAPIAAADLVFPTAGAESVSSTIGDLKAQGFNVMINCLEGRPNVSLSECQVTAINNPSAPTANPIRRSPLSSIVARPNAK